ncbi:hypothetical protein SKAU_G00147490 [Synaphobranchus kaupii]|uniref:Filensin n=1 Tax=Synaphobranchus kaupii TaxID=118154 RepID=A0A9Q1FUJ7_SYNKA|nr:hypothetical protein SKAU_G00147490 [Synaphobranchus kaupii]
MFKTSYRHEVRKERYERSDDFEEPRGPDDFAPGSAAQGWESLQELNERFARYINRARVLEQRNAVFRKQLETLQRMEEVSGLEEAFAEQIGLNRQRVRELLSDRAKLERELKDAERMLDEFNNRYRNECDYQQQLRGTIDQLNKEADSTLLRNLEFQILSQFLQDDINSTKDRHKKNLAEIQTYVNVLHKINQSIPLLPNMSVGISEEQEKLLAQRRVPTMQSQLEEYKSALCQLQSQKHRLQTETSVLEQAIRSTQDGYDDELQLYNEQIEALRRDMEEAERALERYTYECRQLAMYHSSLETELERHKRIIENEDNRLNSAIIGTPITLFTTNYRYTHTTPVDDQQGERHHSGHTGHHQPGRRRRPGGAEPQEEETRGAGEETEAEVRREEQPLYFQEVAPEDVPDGSQISKAFDTLCNIVRDRMRRYKKPEPIADFYTKGRYVLVRQPHPPAPASPPVGGPARTKPPREPQPTPGATPHTSPRTGMPADSMSYEKVEMVESIEKISDDNKVRGYEETAMIVETMIEKTSKKKQGEPLLLMHFPQSSLLLKPRG